MDDGTDNKSGSYVEGSCRCFRSAPANCSAVDMEEEKGEFKTGNRRSNYLCRVCTGIRGNPKTDLFYIGTDLTEYVWTHAWAYVLIGCLMAGIFEETGRFVAFRFFLKKYQDRKDAITYGIGHGGIEAILVLGISGISSIALAAAVNDGSLAQSLSGISTGQLKSVEMQITALAGYGVGRMLLEVCERCIAMTLHIALSVVVFKAVQENQKRYLWIAQLLHAVFDIPAALCQCGVIGMGVAEIWLFVSVLVCVWYAKKVYGTLEEKA